jgi:hypothetical protein
MQSKRLQHNEDIFIFFDNNVLISLQASNGKELMKSVVIIFNLQTHDFKKDKHKPGITLTTDWFAHLC